MFIVHITPYYAPAWAFGGVVTAVTGLATAQAAHGHHVTALTSDALDRNQRHPLPEEVIDGVRVVRCRNLSHFLHARANLSLPVGFGAAVRRLRAEAGVLHSRMLLVLHLHELRTAENVLALRAAPDLPAVLSPHGTLPYGTGRRLFKQGWDALLGRFVLRRIGQVAALTAAEADEARTLWQRLGLQFPGATPITNGVSPEFLAQLDATLEEGAARAAFRDRYQLGGARVVLFLGRLHERKGLQFLIPAFALARQQVPKARLLVVGPDAGMLSTAQALAERHQVAQQVVFTGLLTGDERLAALAAADLFVLPAVGEGLSMAMLEAMAARLPLVLTPGCNLPTVEAEGAGVLVERQVEALASALTGLMQDAASGRNRGERARAWLEREFTWPVIAARTEALYGRLLKEKSSGT